MTDSPRRTPERRNEDIRLVVLEQNMTRVLEELARANAKLDKQNETLNAIQSEPQQFPAGRALLDRAESNRRRIDAHDEDIEALERAIPPDLGPRLKALEAKDSERDGAMNLMRIIQVLIGIALGVLALYAVISGPPPAV